MEDQQDDPHAYEELEDPEPPETTFAINEPVRDIGHLALWTLSSAKPDHGIDALLHASPEFYWQSDGPQPHKLNILFPKRVEIRWISMYFDFHLDESYTPSRIVIYAGTSFYDLTEVKILDLREPRGWQTVNVGDFGRNGVIKCFLIQLAILANHQNGKDTHLRGVKIFAPGDELLLDRTKSPEELWPEEKEDRIWSIR